MASRSGPTSRSRGRIRPQRRSSRSAMSSSTITIRTATLQVCGISSPKASMTTGFASSTPTTSSRRATYRRCGARSRPPRSSIRRRSSRRKSSTSIRAARTRPSSGRFRISASATGSSSARSSRASPSSKSAASTSVGTDTRTGKLWLKIDKLGCRIRKVHDATYIAHVDPKSRNRHASKRERVFWHYEIGHEHYPDIYDESWLARHLGNMGRRG